MTDASKTAEALHAEPLHLRPQPPRVVRLSRKVIAGGASIAGLVIFGALIWALDQPEPDGTGDELFTVDNIPQTDRLAGLPRDYSELPEPEPEPERAVPVLGPPLPGELGRPILRTQGPPSEPLSNPADPEAQRLAQESEAARLSPLFASTQTDAQAGLALPDQSLAGAEIPSTVLGGAQTDPRRAFLEAPVDRRTVSGDRLQPPASPYVVQAGSVIAAALITGIRSDLPGTVTAQVTEHVYDSPTGRHLLIPQGSRLIGEYDSDIAFGQNRVLMVWTRLIYPDGRSVVLERLPASDAGGYAGLQDRVDRHWGRLFLAAGLSTLIDVGGAFGGDDESDIARAIRESAQDQSEDIGGRIIDRELDVPPTLTIRPGYPVRIIIQRDLVLAPW